MYAIHIHRRQIIILLVILCFSILGIWFLMRRADQHREFRLPESEQEKDAAISEIIRLLRKREKGSSTTAPAAPPAFVSGSTFEPFEYDPRMDFYPWHQIHYGHWRRRVIEPGDVQAERSIYPGPEHWEISTVLARAVHVVRQKTGDPRYTEMLCLGGKYRYVPGVGVQYEFYFHDARARPQPDLGHDPLKEVGNTRKRKREKKGKKTTPSTITMDPMQQKIQTYFHTVRLQRKISSLNVNYSGLNGGKSNRFPVVKIIVPYYNSPILLQRALTRFRQLVVDQLQDIELIIVRFSTGIPAAKDNHIMDDRELVGTMVATTNEMLGGQAPRIKLLDADGEFSLAAGWMHGIFSEAITGNAIVFLSHIDLVFGKEFLQRCRANAIPGERVYYPIVFSTYNPDIAYGVIKRKVIPVLSNYDKKALIHEDLGYWLDQDFSVSCHHLSDLKRMSAAMATQISSGLPHRIYERYLKSSVEVVRLPDVDLVQVYKRVQCTRELGRLDYNTCLKTKARNEASKLGWGLWVYKNMGDTDEVENFLKIVRTYQRT